MKSHKDECWEYFQEISGIKALENTNLWFKIKEAFYAGYEMCLKDRT